jgi:hypothetical protein
VFISPHYFFPTDKGWKMNGPLEAMEFETGTFSRSGALSLEGFKNSGADWLNTFKPYIEDGKTIVVSPHKVFGNQTNDLTLQLRKRQINKIVLGGMLANMCVESHLRELLEQDRDIRYGAMATWRRWSTTSFSRTRFYRPMTSSKQCHRRRDDLASLYPTDSGSIVIAATRSLL